MATLAVYVNPKSAENKILGWRAAAEDKRELVVKLTAAPTDGKANEALIKLFSKELGIPKSSISIKSGHASRHKLLSFDVDQAIISDGLRQYPNAL